MSGNRTVLVTGGAGYIGSHCTLSLLENNYDVIVLDNCANTWTQNDVSKPESLKRIEELTGKMVKFYHVDLLHKDKLEMVFEKNDISCVIHFAALKSVAESCRIPSEYYSNNVTGCLNLIRVMNDRKILKLVFSSSATVYGDPQFLPITERHPTGQNCSNPYGKSKYFVEEILRDVSKSDPTWQIYSLRYFNPVGAHPSGLIGEDPFGMPNNLMPVIAQVAVGRLPLVKVYGNDYDTEDGTGVRDYIHIMDLADGHIKALDKIMAEKTGGFRAYNLGTGKGHSVLQVLQTFQRVNQVKVPYEMAARREGDIAASFCDASLAMKELNWRAKFDLDHMCRDMWNWQMKNPKGYAI